MTLDVKAHLRELLAKATPGPWKRCGASGGSCRCPLAWAPDGETCVVGGNDDMPMRAEDTDLIVAAINALPALLDRLERAEKVEREALEAYAAAWSLLDCIAYEREVTDGEAEWLYTAQPAGVWEALRAAGIAPTRLGAALDDEAPR